MLYELMLKLERIARHPLYYLMGLTRGRIVFISTIGGRVELWSSDLDGGDKIRLSTGGVHRVFRPEPGSDKVFYTMDVGRGLERHKIFYSFIDGSGQDEALEMDPIRVTGISVCGDLISYTGASERDIGIYLAVFGGSPEKIYSTTRSIIVTGMDRDYIVGHGRLRGDPRSSEIFILDVKSGEFNVFTPREGSINTLPRIFNGRIYFISDFEGSKGLYVYDIDRGECNKPRLGGDDYIREDIVDITNYRFTPDGRIWFIGVKFMRGYAFIDGYRVRHPDGIPTHLEVYDGDIYMSLSNLKTPPSIYRGKMDGGEWEIVVGKDLPMDIRESLGEVELLEYTSHDGLRVPAILYKSRAGTPGPVVIYIHGGPWAHVDDSWNIILASLVSMGIHVFTPNFRGSTGFGEDYRRLNIGDIGGGDLEDIISAYRYVTESGIASRVALMGYSYGGYLTLMALGKYPDLWACGVAGSSITDWEKLYELSDAYYREYIMTLFDGRRELFRDRSPIRYVRNVKAPVCITHPENDSRVPPGPIIDYCRELQLNNIDYELHLYPGFGHVVTDIDDFLREVFPGLLFLYKYLLSSQPR